MAIYQFLELHFLCMEGIIRNLHRWKALYNNNIFYHAAVFYLGHFREFCSGDLLAIIAISSLLL